jgi:hypothetical protein
VIGSSGDPISEIAKIAGIARIVFGKTGDFSSRGGRYAFQQSVRRDAAPGSPDRAGFGRAGVEALPRLTLEHDHAFSSKEMLFTHSLK